MTFNLRFSYLILTVGLSAVGILGIVGFLNNVYADNQTMGHNMSMNAAVNASESMPANMNMTNTSPPQNMTSTPQTTTSPPVIQKILPPLQQVKSGTSASSVKCDQGFSLVIKIEDGSPACVTPSIVQALVARGWGTMS